MRILLLSFLNPAIVSGGQQQVAFEMFRAAQEAGHEVWLVSAMPDWKCYDHLRNPDTNIVPLQGADDQYLYFPKSYEWRNCSVADSHSNETLRNFITQLRPDIIHFHHYVGIGVEALRMARLAAPHAIIGITFHEMLAICMSDGAMVTPGGVLCERATPASCASCFPDLNAEFFEARAERMKRFLSECDVYVFPSDFLKTRYLEWGLPAKKCVTIQNGQKTIGNSIREQHSRHYNRFGFFGHLMEHKGVNVLLESVLYLARTANLPVNGIVIELNGANKDWATPNYTAKLDMLRRDVEEYFPIVEIVDRGPYDHIRLAERMATCDWVAVPSTCWEVFSLVVSEAWMCGRPVLASAIGGLGERVRHGINGLTFPVGDKSALASLVSMVTGNKVLWHKLNSSILLPDTDCQMLHHYMLEWQRSVH
jgi:glycosyltransferase involved in cell wall biosynthesis